MFIKPYVGANYFFAYTPSYYENGGSASLRVDSTTNNAVSLNVGVDLRKYLGINSYLYVTPSVEQYVVNSGGDYTAGFMGSDTTFTIEAQNNKKTYAQALVGGNINVTDKFNINLGVGAKKILSGKVDDKDELYLTGNLGVKYKF